jgi:hypothetical protein
MDDKERHSAFMSALVTGHYVLHATATVSEAAARASLYVYSLSSALVAIGFASRSSEVFWPFASAVPERRGAAEGASDAVEDTARDPSPRG